MKPKKRPAPSAESCSNLERRLLQRDEQLDQRADMLEERDRKLVDRERELDKTREELPGAPEQIEALERVSGLSAEDAKGVLLEQVREEAEHDAVRLARAIERKARDEAEEKARDVVVTAIQRFAADHTAEHTVTVVHLPSDEMKGRIIGREGRNIRAFEQATGVDLIIDDTPETVVLSGFDPVRREIARLALTKLIADGRIHPGRIEEVVAKARAEVELVIRQAGEQAAYEAGVPGLPPEMVKLLGRLKYRTSYGQNVLEPRDRESRARGDDRRRGRRRRPDRQDGRPAARHRQGGRPRGRGAARRHRRRDRPAPQPLDEGRERASPPTTRRSSTPASRRPIVQIADAISASRPGRPPRDDGDLHQAAGGPGGDRQQLPRRREGVRDPGRPRGAHPRPARGDRRPRPRRGWRATSSSKIEETLTYPGQIKVTVIRETRAVEYAK